MLLGRPDWPEGSIIYTGRDKPNLRVVGELEADDDDPELFRVLIGNRIRSSTSVLAPSQSPARGETRILHPQRLCTESPTPTRLWMSDHERRPHIGQTGCGFGIAIW
jgi:hypothetical protein